MFYTKKLCANSHEIAQFYKVTKRCVASCMARLCCLSESAQKWVGNARRRGGGASARKGGQEGGISFAIRRLPGAHIDG